MYCLEDAERRQPDNLLYFMLNELVLLGYHSQIVPCPYSFASYSYISKILQPYVAATDGYIPMRYPPGVILLYRCFPNENSHEKLMLINKQWFFIKQFRFAFGSWIHVNQPLPS